MTYQEYRTKADPRSDGQGGRIRPDEADVVFYLNQECARHEAKRRFAEMMNPPVALPPVRSLTELLAEPDAEIAYRIESIATTDARTLLASQYKAGKTTLLGNLMRSLADGALFLGRFQVNTPAKRIVLIDDEMSTNMVRCWLRAQGVRKTAAVADVVTLRGNVRAFNLLDDGVRGQWARRLRDLGCDYLIFDCLRPVLDALGLDENHDAGRFLEPFDALMAEAGVNDAAIAHHMGHAGERARGDSRLQDWPDATWRLVRLNDEPDSPRYFSAYGRDVDVPNGMPAAHTTVLVLMRPCSVITAVMLAPVLSMPVTAQ